MKGNQRNALPRSPAPHRSPLVPPRHRSGPRSGRPGPAIVPFLSRVAGFAFAPHLLLTPLPLFGRLLVHLFLLGSLRLYVVFCNIVFGNVVFGNVVFYVIVVCIIVYGILAPSAKSCYSSTCTNSTPSLFGEAARINIKRLVLLNLGIRRGELRIPLYPPLHLLHYHLGLLQPLLFAFPLRRLLSVTKGHCP